MKTLAPCTCLISGGAGFIGSHLAETLLADGHKVLVIDDLSTGRWENIAPLARHPNFHFARASIEEAVVLDRMASESQIIFHLAAAVGVKLIVEKPVHTIETNIEGTKRVLDASLRYRCRTLVASTSEVYGKGSRVPFVEDDDVLLGPTSKSRWAYAASKMVDEFLALAYVAEYGAEIVCARLFNTVGPRQSGQYGMVIPRLVQQALRGEPLTVYGDGQQSRCFGDVRDVVRALIGLAAHEQANGRVYNVGNTEEVTILELAERILRLTGSQSKIRLVPFSEVYSPGFEDMQRRVPDTTRIRQLLNWQPTRDLDHILKSVIEYERQQLGAKR
ncbi:MAG: GDP-mannose 4,6-dehydratase [Verrucomicrobia bacterium]|nr:GDP-mannose 4,6-dehydratase [Verrucomicrobiota bacterium]